MMKKIFQTTLILLIPLFLGAQSVSPEVISSAGDYFEGANASLSWTLGEIATETFSNGSVTLNQGFQQPFPLLIHGIDLDLLVYLEGPYSAGTMATSLKEEGVLPLDQPYNQAPWNYAGSESVTSIPADVVDWVLVEVRDAADAASATSSTIAGRQAAFILNNGSVVALDGTSVLQFTATLANDPYVVVWHRNHLGILSANSLTETGGVYVYDFSSSISQAYGGTAGYKMIDTGIYGMAGGDADADGDVDASDDALWTSNAGTAGYQSADFNLDNQVSNPDKNDVLIQNGTTTSQVPN